AAATNGAADMRHAPDALLICNEHKAVPVREAVRCFEIISIALNEVRLAVTILVPQQRQISSSLFCNNDIVIGRNEQSAAMVQPRDKRRGCDCPAYGMSRDRLAATRSLFGGGRFSALMIKRLPNS